MSIKFNEILNEKKEILSNEEQYCIGQLGNGIPNQAKKCLMLLQKKDYKKLIEELDVLESWAHNCYLKAQKLK